MKAGHGPRTLFKVQIPSGANCLAPPKKNDERRHSLGGRLAAALHL